MLKPIYGRVLLCLGAGIVGAAVAAVRPAQAAVVAAGTLHDFTGGDVGEGLDLDGTFAYAVDFGRPSDSGTIQVRDATFTGPGVTGVTATGSLFDYRSISGDPLSYGGSADDADLVDVMSKVNYSDEAAAPAPIHITLDVDAAETYQLQILLQEVYDRPAEDERHRVQDIRIEGVTAVSDLDLTTETTLSQGRVFTYTFNGADVGANGLLDIDIAVSASSTDRVSIVNALTLETVVPEPAGLALMAAAALPLWRRGRRGRA